MDGDAIPVLVVAAKGDVKRLLLAHNDRRAADAVAPVLKHILHALARRHRGLQALFLDADLVLGPLRIPELEDHKHECG